MEIQDQELKPVRPAPQLLFTYEQLNTITAFERLWSHISYWTKEFIQSSVYDLPNLLMVTDKLYRLPMDFYDIMATYYGTENAGTYVRLLTAYITACVRTIEDIRNGDKERVNMDAAQWYQAADQLASFLAALNPYWDEREWRRLLYQFTQMKVEEIMAAMDGDFEREGQLFEAMENLTFIMGSYMARGIIAVNQYQYGQQSQELPSGQETAE